MRRPRLGDDRGSVVAEFAVALPAVVVVLALGTAALMAAATQVRMQDAASDAARLVSRGESGGALDAVIAASGSSSVVEHRGELVCVTLSTRGPGPLAVIELAATGCALDGGG